MKGDEGVPRVNFDTWEAFLWVDRCGLFLIYCSTGALFVPIVKIGFRRAVKELAKEI
jgi:hypothetical protein